MAREPARWPWSWTCSSPSLSRQILQLLKARGLAHWGGLGGPGALEPWGGALLEGGWPGIFISSLQGLLHGFPSRWLQSCTYFVPASLSHPTPHHHLIRLIRLILIILLLLTSTTILSYHYPTPFTLSTSSLVSAPTLGTEGALCINCLPCPPARRVLSTAACFFVLFISVLFDRYLTLTLYNYSLLDFIL